MAAKKKLYDTVPVVATTSLSMKHPLLSKRRFDFCIVDEASQIGQACYFLPLSYPFCPKLFTPPPLPSASQGVCLGPIRRAKRFVLVGDHHQLPPLVRNAEARAMGMDVSLFKRLSDAHPAAMVELDEQYRMNAEIMSLANALIYDGRLKCGSQAVAEQRLSLPDWDSLAPVLAAQLAGDGQDADDQRWLLAALDPGRPVVFVDTDRFEGRGREQHVGSLVHNMLEAEMCATLLRELRSAGLRGVLGAVFLPPLPNAPALKFCPPPPRQPRTLGL